MPKDKKQALYYYFGVCPLAHACSKASFKKARCNGKTREAAKEALRHHLTESSLHYCKPDQVEAAMASAKMESGWMTDDEYEDEDWEKLLAEERLAEEDVPMSQASHWSGTSTQDARVLPDTPDTKRRRTMITMLDEAEDAVRDARAAVEVAATAINKVSARLHAIRMGETDI